MGLFDKMFDGGKGRDLGPAEAFAGILLGASASDGHIADEEAQGLFTMLSRMRLYENWSGDKFSSTINRLLGMIKRKGVDTLLEKCSKALPQKLHETAFACATDIVLADGVVEPEEQEFMENLQRYLSISGDLALTIVEVMVVKNRG